jgi:hypothetical protein
MPRFAANLSMMFNEVPFLDRFIATSAAGFTAAEFLFPHEYPRDEVAEMAKVSRTQDVLFNMPAGNWGAGERGVTGLPGRGQEFRETIELHAAKGQFDFGQALVAVHRLFRREPLGRLGCCQSQPSAHDLGRNRILVIIEAHTEGLGRAHCDHQSMSNEPRRQLEQAQQLLFADPRHGAGVSPP